MLQSLGYQIERIVPLIPPDPPGLREIDRKEVEVLADKDFQRSCQAVASISFLDISRLASLWTLCRLTDPTGAIVEIGTYRGGGALHLSNSAPDRKILVFDPFSEESFEDLDPILDGLFSRGQFSGHRKENVEALLVGRDVQVVEGFFPASVADLSLPKISFVHLDVDVYKATKESLDFLLAPGVLAAKSLIVIDDYNRRADGVNKAVSEALAVVPGTLVFPLFPAQALIVPNTWQSGSVV
tara:strand:+ start:578 stop:1300 length:723 start_codon:yes stop_codon:yes gene_type:complete